MRSKQTWKYPRFASATDEDKKAAVLAALSIVDGRSPKPTVRMLQEIAKEYMFEDPRMAWPIWQALANNPCTSAKVIYDLEQKQLWYLDILLVQHQYASNAFLHRMMDSRVDIQGKNASSKGFDQNKELRAHASKRLGLPTKGARDDG
jgi:hypothetical protein